MLIGSLVELYVGLHSCLCFSPLKKLVLKCGLIPPQYLFDTLLSVELLKPFLYRNPDSSSIPGGSIENARYLSYRQAFSRHLPRQLPRHLLIPHLSSFTEGSI